MEVISSAVREHLRSDVRQIFSNECGFAALKGDGSVVTWGNVDRADCFPERIV